MNGSPKTLPPITVAQAGIGYWGPNILRNLAANPKHAPTLAQLDAQLLELMREMKDPLSHEALDNPEYRKVTRAVAA